MVVSQLWQFCLTSHGRSSMVGALTVQRQFIIILYSRWSTGTDTYTKVYYSVNYVNNFREEDAIRMINVARSEKAGAFIGDNPTAFSRLAVYFIKTFPWTNVNSKKDISCVSRQVNVRLKHKPAILRVFVNVFLLI